jgi:hypothetical protein
VHILGAVKDTIISGIILSVLSFESTAQPDGISIEIIGIAYFFEKLSRVSRRMSKGGRIFVELLKLKPKIPSRYKS